MAEEASVLRMLEESLWRPETRFDRGYMERVLHRDFFEFGRSGCVYTREQCLDMTPGSIAAELPLPEFAVQRVGDAVALVTYVSVVRHDTVEIANRSSLWIHDDDRWVLRFHQGTARLDDG